MGLLEKIGWKRALFIIGIFGPGIITSLVDNDVGGITTYSVAGARFQYGLLWTLIPITLLLIIVQEMCARMGAVSGKGLSDLIRENFGIKATFFIMVGLVFANLFVTVADFAGIASMAGIFGINKYVLVISSAAIIWVLVVRLNYKILEKVFLFLGLFYLTYIVSGILAHPDWGTVARETFNPSFSLSSGYWILLIAVIGTTITPWMQFYLQSSIVEKGVKKENYKYTRTDVIIGSVITDVVSFFIIVATAAVLFPHGIQINTAPEAAIALEPFAGRYATLLFAVGFLAAGLFGAFIVPLATSFYVCEAFGWESGVNKKLGEAKIFYILLTLIIGLSAFITLIPESRLIGLILASQVVNGLILPIILATILILVNKKSIMGSYTNPLWLNIISWAGCALIVLSSVFMVGVTIFGG
ncbi:Nramp family divalent metal transporter [Candidatus Woesearchaeota archaeon]|nr:Nramp family divalent metal transporter [Candidatus Woesearchaeota archaeon]